MKEQLLEIQKTGLESIDASSDLKSLDAIRVQYLGKKGELTQVLRQMGKLPKEERPIVGEVANQVREALNQAIETRKESLKQLALEKQLLEEQVDVTIDGLQEKVGHHHPLMKVKEELEALFSRMGYDVVEGPEIETVYNNFDALNAPESHPSRDMSDTFYINPELLLRTQTSPVQIRAMKDIQPPIRMVTAGRTFRFDDVDDTHSPMFHQMECLVVGEGVTMANLIDTIETFVHELFGNDIETRFRPHHFPFTEPSAEVDVSCLKCRGEGCEACHYTGWSMELLGCGMVHPKVLENCGIDSEKYTGFAFGLGVDRITMVKYGIPNIRLLFENDMRFIDQF
ncbi:phenylalanine--tRNA ligase subunit alpha [Gottschalkiaceae bacterium SANA]|nr:phenylalanine--tRNA ligase subunit alpha [Gottschalkiaceae bacterium SANA]